VQGEEARITLKRKMGEKWGIHVGVVGALFLSVASSVSIVICNKALMTNLGFPFGTSCFSSLSFGPLPQP